MQARDINTGIYYTQTMQMRLEAREEENAFLGCNSCNKRNFDLGGCNEARRVVRRGGRGGSPPACFGSKLASNASPILALQAAPISSTIPEE